MSYFCLVPEDAVGDEHLTLVWCSKDFDERDDMQKEADRLARYGAVYGTVYEHTNFGTKGVALIALPHRWHLLREELSQYDRSGRGLNWVPHVTLTHYRSLGERILFTKVEWRA